MQQDKNEKRNLYHCIYASDKHAQTMQSLMSSRNWWAPFGQRTSVSHQTRRMCDKDASREKCGKIILYIVWSNPMEIFQLFDVF